MQRRASQRSRAKKPHSVGWAVAPAVLAALAGCDGPQNSMRPAGPAARGLAELGGSVLLVFIVASLVVWILLGWIALRRRGSLDAHEPASLNDGQNWIVIGGVAIPVAVLAIVFIATLQTLSAFPLAHAEGDPEIHITGRQWWFETEYRSKDGRLRVNSPTEVHIPAGRPVQLALQTTDVIHSFWIPRLHGKVDLMPGMINRVRIQADRPGRYLGECAEFCGAQHAHMRIEVVAHTPEDFQSWLARQGENARAPDNAQSRRGQQVFMAAACPLCHTIRGTPAHGSVGPELTHLASRERIAGGMLANDRANLQAWVTQAQSLKPGAQMPNITGFSGEELNALVTYLQSLE